MDHEGNRAEAMHTNESRQRAKAGVASTKRDMSNNAGGTAHKNDNYRRPGHKRTMGKRAEAMHTNEANTTAKTWGASTSRDTSKNDSGTTHRSENYKEGDTIEQQRETDRSHAQKRTEARHT